MRGKSEIPESRIEMDESRRDSEERREVTDALSDWEDGVAISTCSLGLQDLECVTSLSSESMAGKTRCPCLCLFRVPEVSTASELPLCAPRLCTD
jgi:hypothetical protein